MAKKTNEENMNIFIEEMRNAGVKDKTIELVIKDMEKYQRQECEKALRDMFERFKKIMKDKMIGDE